MTDHEKTSGRRGAAPNDASEEVGYGKPPKASRFKPGHSGNPRGRPKKTKPEIDIPQMNEERMKTMILVEAYRPITVRDGEKAIEIPVIQAVLRSLALSAAKGHQRSQKMFTELLRLTESEQKAHYNEYLQTMIEYKQNWEWELEQRKTLGITGHEPIPHPDDIIINMQTGRVELKGPMTNEDKVWWDDFRDRKKSWDDEIAQLTKMLKKKPRDKILLDEMAHALRMREMICQTIPD